MLKQINHAVNNPDDYPDVPRAVKEYLQSVFNHTYQRECGVFKRLRAEGYSEAYIAGVIEGLAIASQKLDDMETRRDNRED